MIKLRPKPDLWGHSENCQVWRNLRQRSPKYINCTASWRWHGGAGMKWSKPHPEGGVPDREARWQQGVEQDVYFGLLGHSAALSSSGAGTQSCQALRRQHLKHSGVQSLTFQGQAAILSAAETGKAKAADEATIHRPIHDLDITLEQKTTRWSTSFNKKGIFAL